MRENVLRSTEAVRRFSDLLNRVRYRGESFTIERGGERICRIEPVRRSRLSLSELAAAWDSLPKPDATYAAAVRRTATQQPKMPGDPWA